ncbi:MAG: hypothetical protein PHT19_06675 [Methylococcus sp.]|nr:hypothetical protein [Methylococcus sp.]
MSRNKYHGRFALERYRGYWLWAVQRRAVLNRPYPKTWLCGRTDTEAEAYGRIAQSLAEIGCEAITGGWLPSWTQVRDQLREEGIALSGGEAERQLDQAAQEARYTACRLLAACDSWTIQKTAERAGWSKDGLAQLVRGIAGCVED